MRVDLYFNLGDYIDEDFNIDKFVDEVKAKVYFKYPDADLYVDWNTYLLGAVSFCEVTVEGSPNDEYIKMDIEELISDTEMEE